MSPAALPPGGRGSNARSRKPCRQRLVADVRVRLRQAGRDRADARRRGRRARRRRAGGAPRARRRPACSAAARTPRRRRTRTRSGSTHSDRCAARSLSSSHVADAIARATSPPVEAVRPVLPRPAAASRPARAAGSARRPAAPGTARGPRARRAARASRRARSRRLRARRGRPRDASAPVEAEPPEAGGSGRTRPATAPGTVTERGPKRSTRAVVEHGRRAARAVEPDELAVVPDLGEAVAAEAVQVRLDDRQHGSGGERRVDGVAAAARAHAARRASRAGGSSRPSPRRRLPACAGTPSPPPGRKSRSKSSSHRSPHPAMTETFKFHTEVRVRFAETDAQGIAHHATYLVWFEVARVDYLARFDGGYPGLQERGVEALTTEAHARYLGPARFNDTTHDRRPLHRRPRRAVPLRVPRDARRRPDRGRLDRPRVRRREDVRPDARARLPGRGDPRGRAALVRRSRRRRRGRSSSWSSTTWSCPGPSASRLALRADQDDLRLAAVRGVPRRPRAHLAVRRVDGAGHARRARRLAVLLDDLLALRRATGRTRA